MHPKSELRPAESLASRCFHKAPDATLGQEFVQRPAAQKMMQEVLERVLQRWGGWMAGQEAGHLPNVSHECFSLFFVSLVPPYIWLPVSLFDHCLINLGPVGLLTFVGPLAGIWESRYVQPAGGGRSRWPESPVKVLTKLKSMFHHFFDPWSVLNVTKNFL